MTVKVVISASFIKDPATFTCDCKSSIVQCTYVTLSPLAFLPNRIVKKNVVAHVCLFYIHSDGNLVMLANLATSQGVTSTLQLSNTIILQLCMQLYIIYMANISYICNYIENNEI